MPHTPMRHDVAHPAASVGNSANSDSGSPGESETPTGAGGGTFLEDAKLSFRLMGPMMLGLVPLGLAFGVLVTQSGFSWYWAPILSCVIYAGSMEFVALGLITSGAGLITGAVTALVVNFRHIFYGLTHPRVSGAQGLYAVYSLTDEAYAVMAGKKDLPERVIVLMHFLVQLAWIVPGVVGAVVGAKLPADLTGIDFVMPALFAALATEAYRNSGTPRMVVLALAATAIATALLPDYALIVALCLYAGIALIPGTMGIRTNQPVIVVDQEPDTGDAALGLPANTGDSVSGQEQA